MSRIRSMTDLNKNIAISHVLYHSRIENVWMKIRKCKHKQNCVTLPFCFPKIYLMMKIISVEKENIQKWLTHPLSFKMKISMPAPISISNSTTRNIEYCKQFFVSQHFQNLLCANKKNLLQQADMYFHVVLQRNQ